MEKTGKTKIICSMSGCSCEAEENSSPPLCARCQIHEKSASVDGDRTFGVKAAAEMSEQLWGQNKDVHNEVSAE